MRRSGRIAFLLCITRNNKTPDHESEDPRARIAFLAGAGWEKSVRHSFARRRFRLKCHGFPQPKFRGGMLMTKVGWMLALILAATLSATAQDAAKKDTPPKPAVGQSQTVLDTWNAVARKRKAHA